MTLFTASPKTCNGSVVFGRPKVLPSIDNNIVKGSALGDKPNINLTIFNRIENISNWRLLLANGSNCCTCVGVKSSSCSNSRNVNCDNNFWDLLILSLLLLLVRMRLPVLLLGKGALMVSVVGGEQEQLFKANRLAVAIN